MSRIERRWEILHKFEQEQKSSFLKKLTMDDSVVIFKDLHQFAQRLCDKANYNKLDIERIQTLARIHSLFKKVSL